MYASLIQGGTGVYIPGDSSSSPQPDAANESKTSSSAKEDTPSQDGSDIRSLDGSPGALNEEFLQESSGLNESTPPGGAIGVSEENLGAGGRNKTKTSVLTDIQREQVRLSQ